MAGCGRLLKDGADGALRKRNTTLAWGGKEQDMPTRITTTIHFVAGLLFAGFLAPPGAHADEARLEMALAVAADFSPVYPHRSFPSPVTELSAAFRLVEGESYEALTATWVAVDVGAAAPPNYVIATSRLDLQGTASGRLRYSQPNPMPVGTYRLEVTADGRPWKSAEFEILPAAEAGGPFAPHEVMPLAPGQSWTYVFSQVAGPGGRIDLADITPDPDGVYRATVEMTVAGIEEDLAHIEQRRNGKLVFEEWWHLDSRGLHAVKRQQGSEVTVLDPAQTLLAFPLAPQTWDYVAADGSFSQTYRMWGPLPVQGPDGEAQGHVVLTTQSHGPVTISVERQFVPGFGLVREVIVQALQGKLLSRQELAPAPA